MTFTKGYIPWNKGKANPHTTGDKNAFWKGDKVGYLALHEYIRKRKQKEDNCEICGKTNCRLELANISGNYLMNISVKEISARK